MKDTQPARMRFGVFELDLETGELRHGDAKIILQEQPLQILRMLVEREGGVVSRDEIRKKLWPNDTIVEFDHSINAAIKKLRRALDDEPEEPRYVETVARRGYRLKVSVEWAEASPAEPAIAAAPAVTPPREPARPTPRSPRREEGFALPSVWRSWAAAGWAWCIRPRT